METKTKGYLFEIGEIVLLSTLMVVRLAISSEENMWISLLNFAGLIVAVASLYNDIYYTYATHKKIVVVTGMFVTILIVLVIMSALILANAIIPSVKWNDMVLLITLLVSLPSRFYKDKIGKLLQR